MKKTFPNVGPIEPATGQMVNGFRQLNHLIERVARLQNAAVLLGNLYAGLSEDEVLAWEPEDLRDHFLVTDRLLARLEAASSLADAALDAEVAAHGLTVVRYAGEVAVYRRGDRVELPVTRFYRRRVLGREAAAPIAQEILTAFRKCEHRSDEQPEGRPGSVEATTMQRPAA